MVVQIARELLSIADGESPIHTPLTLFLIQLIVVVSFSKILALLLKKIKQPMVIAEVITGIILGPSVFGHIPGYTEHLFPDTSITTFNVIAQVGLIIFLFIVGLELDVGLMKKNVGVAIFISLTAIITPFALGLASSYAIYKLAPVSESVPFGSFLLFVGVAMSITAFPVLARIMTETKLIRTRVGVLALSAAAVDDVVAWCILAIVVAIARATSPLSALYTILMLLLFLAIMFGLRFLLQRFAVRRQTFSVIRLPVLVMVFIMIFICAWLTEIIGVHAIFGAFVWGICVPRTYGFNNKLIERIEDIVVIIFLPLYFTYSGLRTNIGALSDGKDIGLTILIIVVACIGKIAGGTIAAKITKNTWRESFTIGILMNTKGLVELIVLNVGLDVGVLDTKVFTMFVLMALVTTFLTQPLLYFVYLRHIKHELKEKAEGESGKFSIVAVSVNNKKLLRHIVKIFANAFRDASNMKLTALFLAEVSDRPSTLFGGLSQISEWKQKRESRMNLIRDTMDHDPETNAPEEVSEPQDVEMNPVPKDNTHIRDVKFELTSKILDGTSLGTELSEYTEVREIGALFFVAHSEGAKQMLPSLTATISIAKLEQLVARAFDWDVPELAVIRYALENIKCPIAVMIETAFTTKHNLKSALWVIQKQKEAHFINPIVSRMTGVSVTIIGTEYPESVPEKQCEFISSNQPLVDGLEYVNSFEMIVIAGDRKSLDDFNSPFVASASAKKKPVIVVYPPLADSGLVDLP